MAGRRTSSRGIDMNSRTLHQKALSNIRSKGAALSPLYDRSPGQYDPETGGFEEERGDRPRAYLVEIPKGTEGFLAGEVIQQGESAIFCVPEVLGKGPDAGMYVLWAGRHRRVKSLQPIRPFGEMIACTLIVE